MLGGHSAPIRTLVASWCSEFVVGHGEKMKASALPALVATVDGEPVGVLTYAPRGPEWEVVTLNAVWRGVGVGTALLDALRAAARAAEAERVRLITTNDNTGALRFYQRYGFDLVALHRDAVTRSRAIKPEIPLSRDGIPLRHELELELLLRHSAS